MIRRRYPIARIGRRGKREMAARQSFREAVRARAGSYCEGRFTAVRVWEQKPHRFRRHVWERVQYVDPRRAGYYICWKCGKRRPGEPG